MKNEIESDELIIDFSKIFKIIYYRKDLILKIFLGFIVFFLLLTFILPKKYETDASIYINKSNNTNLMEMNPFILASMSTMEGGLSSMISGASNVLQNEIAIIKSPLVLDNVIRENNLRYNFGKKKGEFLSTKDFLKKNLSIENEKGTNVVNIKYKSKNAVLSYNVVNSIINNYEKINEEINIKKTIKDKALLESSYQDTNRSLNRKLAKMKNSSMLPDTALNSLGMLAALKGHNRAIGGAMGSIQGQVVEGKKSEINVQQDVDKLSLVKSKLEWTKLVEQISKDTTNVIVLKKPEIKKSFEQASPKLLVNLIYGLLFGIVASFFTVLFVEKYSEKLTYSTLNGHIIYNIDKDFDDLKLVILARPREIFSLLCFEGFNNESLQKVQGFGNVKVIKAEITSKTLEDISASNNLIFAAKIGETSKKTYEQFKQICLELNKPVCKEVI